MIKVLKCPKILNKTLKYKNKMGVKLAALALALGIGSFSLVGNSNDTITLSMTKDLPTDLYENCVPVFLDKDTKKLMTTLENNILLISQELIENNDSDKSYLISAIDNQNNIISGYIQEKYISNSIQIDKENTSTLYKVDSERGINLRKSAEVQKNNKIAGIPNGAILFGDSKKENDSSENAWSKVIYYNGQNLNEGFVASKYLKTLSTTFNKKSTKDISPIEFEYTTVNNGEVFGIDVSGIHPKRLEKLLTGELTLPENVKNRNDKILNISHYENRKINFVYIKLMASNVFSKDLTQGKTTRYKELAEVCEKNGVPYGFYYYSTCINEKEAIKEFKWISDSLNSLNNTNFNVLPFAIDVEIYNEKDRQYASTVEELTSAKSKLANLLENNFGKTILYTSRNACDSNLKSKILDIDQYQNELQSGKSHIWFVAPDKSKRHQDSLEQFAEHVTAKQVALDIKTDNKIYNVIDLNTIKEEAFVSYLNGDYNNLYKSTIAKNNTNIYLAQNEEKER